MKTITITDESFEFLQDFIKVLNGQDTRGTSFPYVYAVRDIKRVYGVDPDYDNDGFIWVWDGEECSTDDIIDYVVENDDVDRDDLLAELDEVGRNNIDTLKCTRGYDIDAVYYKNVRVVKNVFFTEEQAKGHIKDNHYHFDDPDIYVIHLFRNDEMVNLVDAIEDIVNQKEEANG